MAWSVTCFEILFGYRCLISCSFYTFIDTFSHFGSIQLQIIRGVSNAYWQIFTNNSNWKAELGCVIYLSPYEGVKLIIKRSSLFESRN